MKSVVKPYLFVWSLNVWTHVQREGGANLNTHIGVRGGASNWFVFVCTRTSFPIEFPVFTFVCVDSVQWPPAAKLPLWSVKHGAASMISNIHPGQCCAFLTAYHGNHGPGGTQLWGGSLALWQDHTGIGVDDPSGVCCSIRDSHSFISTGTNATNLQMRRESLCIVRSNKGGVWASGNVT